MTPIKLTLGNTYALKFSGPTLHLTSRKLGRLVYQGHMMKVPQAQWYINGYYWSFDLWEPEYLVNDSSNPNFIPIGAKS